jgi:hypothetical protein
MRTPEYTLNARGMQMANCVTESVAAHLSVSPGHFGLPEYAEYAECAGQKSGLS